VVVHAKFREGFEVIRHQHGWIIHMREFVDLEESIAPLNSVPNQNCWLVALQNSCLPNGLLPTSTRQAADLWSETLSPFGS